MEIGIEEHVGAGRHERAETRTGHRNGCRKRTWDTRVGTVDLDVPWRGQGGYFPSLLDPRRQAERAHRRWLGRPTTRTGSPRASWTSW